MRALLEGTQSLEGLSIDTEMRWRLLIALARCGATTEEEIAAELARDNTATGRERAEQALAALPTPQAKATAWRRAVEERTLPNSVIEAVAAGFVDVHDPSLLEPYVARFHTMLDGLDESISHAIVEILVTGFYPSRLVSSELHDATQAWLDANPSAPAALRRLVVENRDPVARALKAQARDANA